MGSEFSTNVGLNIGANKQYAVVKQAQPNKSKAEEDYSLPKEKGFTSNETMVDMSNPNIDKYITAMAEMDEASKTKKKYQPTLESLKERLAKAMEDRNDNAHNLLLEMFYGMKVNTCNSMLGMLGADPAELDAIKRKANEEAKQKVRAGYERLATAYAEYEIYAS